jgi:hypothetical protein
MEEQLKSLCSIKKESSLISIIGKNGDNVIFNNLGFSKLFVPESGETNIDVYSVSIRDFLSKLNEFLA